MMNHSALNTQSNFTFRCALLGIIFVSLPMAFRAEGAEVSLQFNRDIRPILSDKCFQCHGPDGNERQAGLRLDTFAGATRALDSGLTAIVAGDPDHSELLRRIESAEEFEQMPPADSGKSLTNREKQLLREWIASGAAYEKHWSLIPPQRPPLPEVVNRSWCHNEIDHFVLAKLEEAGLAPSPAADRATLLRRVTFDLTGLPPTVAELSAFLEDASPDAYEKVVDRLLNSPHYGERMASYWLDLARYADTDGYEKDGHRQMWPYRDWVIRAFNENMPFDQFTIEQIAGDLLPDAQQSQLIASAFNRNNPTTSEAGADPEEYSAKYAVDRVATTSTVWLGLTMQCAECHDHKFDPLSTEDFYKFFAFFNQIPEDPLYEGAASPPSIPVPNKEQSDAFMELDRRLVSLRKEYEELGISNPENMDVRDGLIAEYTFDEPNGGVVNDTSGGARQAHVSSANIKGNASPERVTTPLGRGMKFRGGGTICANSNWQQNFSSGISYGAWVKPLKLGGVVVSKINSLQNSRGFDLFMQEGHAIVHIIDSWPNACLKVSTTTEYNKDEWTHVFVVWNGGSQIDSVKVFFNGKLQPLQIDKQSGTIQEIGQDDLLLVGSRHSEESPFHGFLDEVRIYNRVLNEKEVHSIVSQGTNRVVSKPASTRTLEECTFLRNYYRNENDGTKASFYRLEIANAEVEQAKLRQVIPQLRVMQPGKELKPTFVLTRGDYRTPGKQVSADIPSVFGQIRTDEPVDRVDLATWMVNSQNPMTARVKVNRLWALCFGQGIVKTLNDFGLQGTWPSHPELLDFLATTFADDWDIKALLRTIVTSTTYRQSSVFNENSYEIDPSNSLLWRGPRFRLPAEMLRDNALLVSGLMNPDLGGPSVFPYHPAGLWEEMAWADSPWKVWTQDHGPNLYRRALYTFWKRSLLHPVLAVFDAPARNVCEVQRPLTNTPLQALVTLNETSFVEAARVLADRLILDHPADESARVSGAYLRILSRLPQPEETEALLQLASRMKKKFQNRPDHAEEYISVGEAPRSEQIGVVELAAWTSVMQSILNLDEALTKE